MPAFVVGVANLSDGSYLTVGCFNLSILQLNTITESITLTCFFYFNSTFLSCVSVGRL